MSLKWTGLLDATSVLSVQVGTRTSLMVATAAVVVYLGYNEAMMAHLRRVGSASRTVLHAVLVGDLVLILMVLVSVTPPSEYARGLILTVFVVQFTRLYFGLRATVVSIMAAAVGYTGLIVASTLAGALAEPAEQFWNLAIFLLGSLMLGGLHGQVAGRLERVLQLFERYGLKETQAAIAGYLDFTEKRFRAAIDRLPAGRYEAVDYLDGNVEGETCAIKLALTIGKGRMRFDFTGSGKQLESARNKIGRAHV